MDTAAPLFKVGDRVRMARSLHPGTEELVGQVGRVVEVDDITADGQRLQVNYRVEFTPEDSRYLHSQELVAVTDYGEQGRRRFLELVRKLHRGSVSTRGLAEMSEYVLSGLQVIEQSPETPPGHAEAAVAAAIFTNGLLLSLTSRAR
jgi:hypothetical protein